MRQLLPFAAVLILLAGCGDPPALTLADQGVRELQAGHYDAAIATCNAAITANPKDAAAYHCRGRAYHYRNQPGDIDRAIADFDESIQLAPKDSETYYSRSIAFRDQGNAEASAKDELKARELDTKLKETYAELPDMTPPGAASTDTLREVEEPKEPKEPESKSAVKSREATNREDDEILDRARARSLPASARPVHEPLKRVPDTKADSSSDDRIRELLTEPQYNPPARPDPPDAESNSGVVPMPRARSKSTMPMRAGRRSSARPSAGMARVAPETQTPPTSGPTGIGQYTGPGQYAPNYRRPVQSPFPQAPARPTGRFEEAEAAQNPYAPAPRQTFSNPYSAGPAVQHLPGAYQTDYNP